ncbi:hypothetical protein RGQ29_018169 [Quercus rubra]|uniref:Uncharacterized protein n=1 Tax=Quercus rubra TaxID=3512 RepID=A0AAN7IYR4_QUERU|nr:hypothetical protein RGQ29_018169 [Quercus rubra]
MLDQDSNPVFFDFFMLTGGALGDKQHVSSSDFLLLSYGAYIDVNFVVTGIKRRETVIKCAEDVRPLPESLPFLKLKQMGSNLQSRYPSSLELSVSTKHSLNC